MTKLNLMERLRSWAHNRSLDLKPRRHGMVGPAAMWKMKRDFQIGFLKGQGLEPHHRLMDVGCGTLRGGIPMIRYLNEGNYYGCDVRSEALEEARRELEDEGLTEKGAHLINSGDFDALQLDVEFDVMYGFSVLIHMEDAIVEKCFAFAARHLTPTGRFFANVNVPEDTRPPGEWLEFPVVFKSYPFYEAAAATAGLETRWVGTLKELGHLSGNARQDQQVMLEFTLK